MSILDSVRDAVSSVIPVGKNSEDDIQHGSTRKKQAEIGEDGVPQSVLDAINNAENGDNVRNDESYDDSENGNDRTDILELLNIDANYTIPDEYMLPEDFERVVFDKVRPEGYDEKMVNAFYDSAYNTVGYLLDLLKKRNKDIATLATQIDKMSTDLHNAKLNAEISDGLTVMTGAPSEDAISLQQAQNEIRKLRGVIKKMEGAGLQPTDDNALSEKYDALQNQVGILKSKIQQLNTENKRLRLGRSANIEDDIDVLNDDPIVREAADDAGGMPMPWSGSAPNDDNSLGNLTMGAQSYANGPRTIGDTLSADDELDVDGGVLPMPGASSNTRGDDPNNDPNNGLRMPSVMPSVTPAVPGNHDNDSNDGGLPLPSIMDESYEDIGIPLDNNSDDSDGEIDLASMIV